MSTWQPKDIVDLVHAVAWPVVGGAGLIVLREPIRELLRELPKRAAKISIFDFSIELAKMPVMTTTWSAGAVDVRRLTPANLFDSNTHDLIAQITDSGAADYAIIDLGGGDQWLTSRLFIMAELLGRMRSLKCLVFVQTRETPRPAFIGWATPQAVRWCLARSYPMLETALAHAYASVMLPVPPTPPYQPAIRSAQGALETGQAANLLRQFLQSIQVPNPPDITQWISLGTPPVWEYAQWTNAQRLNGDLADVLCTSFYEDSPDKTNSDRITGILRRRGNYVALVNEHGLFEEMIDRELLLEKTAVPPTAVPQD